MREKQTYENTITSKLEALPLPNLEDAIWARIEAQLDIDLPGDDGGAGGNTPAPKGPISFGWFGGLGLFCVVAILISIFTLTNSNVDRSSTSTQEILPVKRDSIAESPPPLNTPNVNRINSIPAATSPSAPEDPGVPMDTSAAIVTPPPLRLEDSLTAGTGPPVNISPPKDSVSTGRRSRGVKGITDSDYRIVPKKDTIVRNQ